MSIFFYELKARKTYKFGGWKLLDGDLKIEDWPSDVEGLVTNKEHLKEDKDGERKVKWGHNTS